jgi:hypothetical protein
MENLISYTKQYCCAEMNRVQELLETSNIVEHEDSSADDKILVAICLKNVNIIYLFLLNLNKNIADNEG